MEKLDPGTGKKILGIGNALVDTLIRIPDDAAQNIIKIVRDAAGQHTQALEFLRLSQF